MKKLKIYYLLFALIFCFNVTSYSQTTDKKQIMQDTVKANEIKLLLKVSGTTDFAYVIIDDVMSNYKKMIKEVPEDYWIKLKQQIDISSFTSKIVAVYDKRFSVEEIRVLITFFQSPVGTKWAVSLKDMNDEVMIQADIFGKFVYESLNKQLEKDGYMNSGK